MGREEIKMKSKFRFQLLVGVVLLLATFVTAAQEPDDLSIAQLKEQIQKLESIDRDPTTPFAVKSINRDFLNARRAQLRTILARRIEALRKYQAGLGSALTTDESKVIENAISLLEMDLQDLEKKTPANAALESTPMTSPTKVDLGGNGGSGAMVRSAPARNTTSAPLSNAATVTPQNPANVPASGCYADAPALIVTNIERAAGDMVTHNNSSPLSAYFPDIFFYTLADAVSSERMDLRQLKAYQYMGETARTDKQVGASARAPGSTSAIEKPGFANLLGFAIENGIIQQQTNATSLTLSTSPYAFIAASQGDSADTYQKYDFLNRIGVSANFNLTNQATPLANASRKQLNEWSVRVRLLGDRSTRGVDFRNYWNKNIKGKVQRRLVAIVNAARVIDSDDALRGLSETTKGQLMTSVKAILASSDPPDKKTANIKNAALCGLRQLVFDQLSPGGGMTVSAATQSVINSALVPELISAHEELEQARQGLKDFLAQQEKKPEMTFAYSDQHPASGKNYSVFGLLYERKSFEPVKLVANGGFSLYHRPDRKLNQQSIRDLVFALSFEGKASSPFLTNEQDLSKITFSFTGRYQRIFENRHQPNKKADIAVAHFKLEIPVLSGMSIPFSVTFANASELIKEKHIRANFGFSFDADKLFALTQLKKQ